MRLPRSGVTAAIVVVVTLESTMFTDLGPPQASVGRIAGLLTLWTLPLVIAGLIVLGEHRTPLPAHERRWIHRGALFTTYAAIIGAVTTVWSGHGPDGMHWKILSNLVLFCHWLALTAIGALLVRRHGRMLSWAAAGVLSLCAVVLALELIGALPAVGALHAGPNIQNRPRLFTLEASSAGLLVASLGFIALLNLRSPRTRAVVLVGTSVMLLLIRSKGTLLMWTLGLVSPWILRQGRRNMTHHPRWTTAALVLAAGILVVVAVSDLFSGLTTTTSASTRLAYWLSGPVALYDAPWGGGLGGYTLHGQDWLQRGTDMLRAIPFTADWNRSELDGLLTQQGDSALIPKDLPSMLYWIGGWPGLLFAGFLYIDLLRRPRHDPMHTAMIAFVALSSLTFTNVLHEPAFMLAWGAARSWPGHPTGPLRPTGD